MSTEIRRLLDRVQAFADAVGAWQDSDEGGYDALIGIACEAKADFDAQLALLSRSSPWPPTEELIVQRGIGHGEGQEHAIADVNAGRVDDLIRPRLDALRAQPAVPSPADPQPEGYQEALHRPVKGIKP